MKKIVPKSIELARKAFESAYDIGEGYRVFHWAFIWERNRLISIGQNDPLTPSPKALYFAKRYGCDTEYPFIHAEVDAISKVWGRVHLDKSHSIVVVRLNSFGETCLSKPCENCQKVIDGIGFKEVIWTTESGVEYG